MAVEGNVTRCDIRFPNEIYEKIQNIAIERYKASIHHRSGKPEVSHTIIELVKLGIASIENSLSDNQSDKLSDKKEAEIVQKVVNNLSDRLPDILSDKIQDVLARGFPEPPQVDLQLIQKEIENLKESSRALEKILRSASHVPLLSDTISDKEIKYSNGKEKHVSDNSQKSEATNLSDKPSDKLSDKGLTDTELAKILEKDSSTINRWRTGRRKPRSERDRELLNQWEAKNGLWYPRQLDRDRNREIILKDLNFLECSEALIRAREHKYEWVGIARVEWRNSKPETQVVGYGMTETEARNDAIEQFRAWGDITPKCSVFYIPLKKALIELESQKTDIETTLKTESQPKD
jgi:transcriptional regulator with XRE-family HTH domain